MDQPISRRQHAIPEFTMIPSIAAAPAAFGFTHDKTASTLCYVLSGTALLSALFTRAEWGAVKVIPYKTHLALDAVSGLTALAAPWLFGFAKNTRARNAFLAMGAIASIVTALSRPEEMPKYRTR
ncbi:hypothetical protein D3Y59_10990 [Hymenobacter oligotrophus]|uniref:SPW repeat-containing integral membrane domain-containing protein n=1 Tax=Hymenobacter oligotrophus TaxID=2319843 RepID=A0A3B7R0N1_9BACT|nr:hypothetical protein [Hymenobacter oligotrophus]AYA37525.1 hypothetical protein D3Y59_10990 [Hymenobacter oligotrophus]